MNHIYTKNEIEAQCREDHKRNQGYVVNAAVVYVNGSHKVCPVHGGARIPVQICKDCHVEWDGKWCYPHWKVKPLNGIPGFDIETNYISIRGVSRSLDGEALPKPLWEPYPYEEEEEVLSDAAVKRVKAQETWITCPHCGAEIYQQLIVKGKR